MGQNINKVSRDMRANATRASSSKAEATKFLQKTGVLDNRGVVNNVYSAPPRPSKK